MSTFARSVGRNIRRSRQAAGMDQATLAARCGLRQSTVSRYESGAMCPGLRTFAKLGVALGVSPCELLPGLEWDPMERS
jgi:transcriptional regulator with XRE-family HTH domain